MQIETPQAVAIYCRLSKEDLDENKIDNLSRSIQNQKSMLTDFAEINGWQIFDIYCDDNLSGVARDRPEFNRLIRDASLRKFNIILCKNQSRFTRDMQLVEKYIHGLFPIWGIRFVGMVDGADTSVKGNKKARQINGLVNEWYLEDMSENIKSSLDDLRRKGHHIGAWVRYGYMKDPNQKGHIIPDPVAAAVVEKTILDQLDILAAKYKDGSLFSEIMDEESTIGIEIKRLKAELAQHKKKLVEYETGLKCLYLDKASGSISNSDYQFLSRELSAGKELAERKVDLCTENYNKILRSQEILREKAGVLESYSRPKELTRSMVETFIDHIVICSSSDGTSKQEIKIYWNF